MQNIEEVKVKKKELNIIVWLLPIISLFIAGWLIYKYYSSQGPIIEIYFQNSGGLEPKKSFVRFRDVKVGVVDNVVLLKKGVLVKIRMHKDVKPFLNESTKFWIVTPTIEVGKVKGIEALITGPYIQMYAKDKGFKKIKFNGLNEPPLDPDILNGKIVKLISKDSYSLSEKMPVYYKSIKVGSIRRVKLNNAKVEIIISIKKEYSKFINDSTKFWNLRGIDITLDKDNLKVIVPGVTEILIGGIEFETLELNSTQKKDTFILYPSKNDAYENKLGINRKYENVIFEVVNNKNSLLKVGNPIIFKGFKIGYVENLISFLDKNYDVKTLVYAKIDIGAFGGKKRFIDILKKGLVAKIVKNNPIFGNVKIKLLFSKPNNRIVKIGNAYKLDVLKDEEINIIEKINKIVDKFNNLDFNRIVIDMDKTINNANSLIYESRKNLNKVPKIIDNLNNTLQNIQILSKTYSKDSIFYIKINEILKDLHKNLIQLYKLEKKLDKKPNALIFGD